MTYTQTDTKAIRELIERSLICSNLQIIAETERKLVDAISNMVDEIDALRREASAWSDGALLHAGTVNVQLEAVTRERDHWKAEAEKLYSEVETVKFDMTTARTLLRNTQCVYDASKTETEKLRESLSAAERRVEHLTSRVLQVSRCPKTTCPACAAVLRDALRP